MTQGPQAYDIATIRQLLTEAFTPEELRRFCLDRPLFRPVVARFGPAHGLDDMVDEVIDYCRTQLLFAPLLAELQAANPRQYAQFFGGGSRPPGQGPEAHGRRLEIGELRVGGCSMRNMVLLLSLTLVLAAALGGVNLMMGRGDRRATPTAFIIAGPPTPTSPSSETGHTWTRPADGAVMVYVPAGEFLMGSTEADAYALDAEKPQHAVYLDGFWIDSTEVTNAQYRRCVEAGSCQEPGCWDDVLLNAPGQPVVCVTWDQARAYAAWAGGRLPTEAEWEKAARGADGRLYPWGSTQPDCEKANYSGCADRPDRAGAHPSGASPYGALDMAGNVFEWTQSVYREYPYDPHDGREAIEAVGLRVLRGGAFDADKQYLRCASRIVGAPLQPLGHSGFRLAADPGPTEGGRE